MLRRDRLTMARLQDPRFAPDCTITFEGKRVPARTGETVAAALLAAGQAIIARSSKYHRPRGAFCLAGSCNQCLARVDGLPNQRTCRTPCREGLVVEAQNTLGSADRDLLGLVDLVYARGLDHHRLMTWNRFANRAAIAVARQLAGLGKLPDRAVPPFPSAREEQVDALVVGAGPAGLGAAEVLADAGRHVLVAEGEPRAGGRLRCLLQLPGDPTLDWAGGVCGAVTRAGGEVALGAAVVGLWTDGGLCAVLLQEGAQPRVRLVRPRGVILATGTHAEPPAFEDSDLPGVLAGRGLLVALAECGVVPGEQAAVLGHGPEADAVADRLAAAGMQAARLSGVPVRALGRARLNAVVMSGGARVECDTLAVATPRAPAAELARLAGAALTLDPAGDAFRLSAGEGGRVAAGVYVAGEVLGAMDAEAAVESGRRAAEAALAERETRRG
jgi:sarcosine oxidase subunit alpha